MGDQTIRGDVLRLTLERGEGWQLNLTLAIRPTGGLRVEELRFIDVSDLRFQREGTRLSDNAFIIIRDITKDGLEGIHHRVYDGEHELVEFYCASYTQHLVA